MSQAPKRESGSAPPISLVRPIAVFALSDRRHQDQLTKHLKDVGVEARFVTTDEELLLVQRLPHCFATFIDLVAFSKSLTRIKDPHEKLNCFHVGIASNVTRTQSAKLFSLGLADLLTNPVHLYTYRSQARRLLVRFVKQFSMPENVELPAGISRPSEQQLKALAGADFGGIRRLDEQHEGAQPKASNLDEKRPMVMLSKGDGRFGSHQTSQQRLAELDNTAQKFKPHEQLFAPINSEDRRQEALKELAKKNCPAILWTREQKWRRQFTVHSYEPSNNSMILDVSRSKGDDGEAFDFLTLDLSDQFFVSVNLSTARVFSGVRPESLELRPEGLSLHLLSELFETQRRTHFRLKLIDHPSPLVLAVAAQLGGPSFNFQAADVSANGVQLIVDTTWASRLKAGDILSQIVFRVYGQPIKCSATVRWVRGDRVGLQFFALSEQDEMGLQLYVMEESYVHLKGEE